MMSFIELNCVAQYDEIGVLSHLPARLLKHTEAGRR